MQMKVSMEELEKQAELLKAIAHPIRLCIVKGILDKGSCMVSEMQDCLSMPQSTVSQHIGKLKSSGIIVGERDGTQIHYKVVDETVKAVINKLF